MKFIVLITFFVIASFAAQAESLNTTLKKIAIRHNLTEGASHYDFSYFGELVKRSVVLTPKLIKTYPELADVDTSKVHLVEVPVDDCVVDVAIVHINRKTLKAVDEWQIDFSERDTQE